MVRGRIIFYLGSDRTWIEEDDRLIQTPIRSSYDGVQSAARGRDKE